MKVLEKIFDKAILFELDKYYDERGNFIELYSQRNYSTFIGKNFVQDNISYSKKNVLRGLHFQIENPQGKLIYPIKGEIFDVIVDINKNSNTFGQHYSVSLSEENNLQLWVPDGFAHGFCVTSNEATIVYKCTDFYNPSSEKTIIWDDSELDIKWPNNKNIISDKDKQGKKLSELF